MRFLSNNELCSIEGFRQTCSLKPRNCYNREYLWSLVAKIGNIFLFVIAVNFLLFVTEFNRYVIKGEIKPIGDFLYLLLFRKWFHLENWKYFVPVQIIQV